MHRLSRLTLALLAAFALTALASASASAALPEFSASKYPVTYKITHSEVLLESGNGNIDCIGENESQKISGEITSATTATATWTLTSCEETPFHGKCTSEGAALGEIKTASLPVKPVYISKENKNVGLEFNYVENLKPFAKFQCEGDAEKSSIKGAVIARITPVNAKVSLFSVNFNGGPRVESYPLEFEWNPGEWRPLSVRTGSMRMNTAAAIEVKA